MAAANPIDNSQAVATSPDVGIGYRSTVETTYDAAAALELWRHAANPRVFNHPAWSTAAIEAFGANRPLRVIHIRQGETTVAIWPLWIKQLGAREMFARVLEPAGARVTDYCQPLLRSGHSASRLTQLFLQQAAKHLDARTLLLWPKLPIAGGADHLVDQVAQAEGLLCADIDHPCPAMALPAHYSDLERTWSKSHRGDIRRQIKRLGLAGRVELVTARDRAEVMTMLPRLYAMHTANWQARHGSTDLETGPMTTFVAALAATLPMNLIEASEVHIDGRAISCHFGFREQHRLLWYKPTFDVAWANYAPGKVHIALATQRSIAEGLSEFDFMQGNEPYKRLWADLTTETKSFALGRPMAYPIWRWNTAVRGFAAEYRI